MEIALQLDAEQKKTVTELFLASTHVPAPAMANGPMAEDSLAIFRIAKEYSLTLGHLETRSVQTEDLARMIRFAGWLLTYGGATPVQSSSTKSSEDGRTGALRKFIVTAMLQAQSQYSGFESILRALGVDRQLEPLGTRASTHARHKTEKTAALTASHSSKTNQVYVRIDQKGAELLSTTTETAWSIDALKRATKS